MKTIPTSRPGVHLYKAKENSFIKITGKETALYCKKGDLLMYEVTRNIKGIYYATIWALGPCDN